MTIVLAKKNIWASNWALLAVPPPCKISFSKDWYRTSDVSCRCVMQEMKDMDEKIQTWQDKQESLSNLKTRLEMVVSRNASTQVQLIASYGEEELDIELSELETWEKELEPRIAGLLARLDRLQYDIKVPFFLLHRRYIRLVVAVQMVASCQLHCQFHHVGCSPLSHLAKIRCL